MKKIFVVILILGTLLITGCKSKSSDLLQPATKGDIIVYNQNKLFSSLEEKNDYYYIKVTTDKKIVWGKAVSGKQGTKELSDKEYQSIIDMAFSKDFKNMSADISDNSISDGYSAYITIYYSDDTTFKVGGTNPNSEKYNNLVKELKSYTE